MGSLSFIEWFSIVAGVASIVASLLAFYQAWQARNEARLIRADRQQEETRQRQRISVVLRLKGTDQTREVLAIRRSDFSRAEVQGRLRTFLLKGKDAFSIAYLSQPEYIAAIDRIKAGSGRETLEIFLDEKESRDFDHDRLDTARTDSSLEGHAPTQLPP